MRSVMPADDDRDRHLLAHAAAERRPPGWAPPPGTGRERALLVFRLDPVGPEAEDARDDREFRAAVRRALAEAGAKSSDRWWAEASLDDPRAVATLVEVLERLGRDGIARPASGRLGVWLEDCDESPLEWFELDPRRTFPLRRSSPYNEASAGELPLDCHVASAANPYVSDSFRKAVDEEGLRGLELLWVKDVGRYQAPQWYLAIPRAAIGRGLDHPRFDRAAFEAWWRTGGETLSMLDDLRGRVSAAEREELDAKRDRLLRRRAEGALAGARRFGARQFDTRFLRPVPGFADDPRERLIQLFRFEDILSCLSISSPLVVLRRFLPDADFAFSWGAWDGGARDEDEVRYGRLCFTRRVRDALVRRRLVEPDECRGVRVVDEPPLGVPVFDDREHRPPPLVAPDELARLREEEARLLARFASRPRRPRTITLAAALGRLREARRRHGSDFGKPARAATLDAVEAQLGQPLPEAWRAVLGVADGFELEADDQLCRVAATSALVSLHRDSLRHLEETLDRPQPGLLCVGSWLTGDLLALEVGPGERRPGCAVLRIDHEELAESRRWPGVAEFLDEWLSD